MCISFILSVATVSNAAMLLEYDGDVHNYTGNIYTLSVDGKKISTPLEPIIFNDRALVPVREVFEATGAVVNYNANTKGIHISGDGINIIMNIGSTSVLINDELKTFPDGVSPKLIAKMGESAKTMVPVRFISENLGYTVNFADGVIDIVTPNAPKPDTTPVDKPDVPGDTDGKKDDEKELSKLTSVYLNGSGDKVMISVKADGKVGKVTEPVLTSSGVLYVDIYDTVNALPSEKAIGKGAVSAIRTGVHDEYTRIALDTKDLMSHSVKISEDKTTVKIITVKKPQEVQTEKYVVLDAGHGGSDGGAVGELDGKKYNEKDINLAVTKQVEKILTSNGVKVKLTRTGDTYPQLEERSAFANELNAAIFVSIHSNSATVESANGIEVFYASKNNGDEYGVKSQELADKILTAMITHTKANNRKVKTENHLVTRTSVMPAALVELGFVSNKAELKNLLDEEYQYSLASGIAEGIMKCLPKITIPDKTDTGFDPDKLGDKIF